MAFKRIFCAVDFSRDSIEAFHAAVEIARQSSAMIRVFHVIEAEPVVNVGDVVVRVLEKANAAMATLIESAKSVKGPALTSEVTTGLPSDEIIARAKDWKADLVVLGAQGAGLLEKIVGGTVEHVVKKAPCSVLVVRGR